MVLEQINTHKTGRNTGRNLENTELKIVTIVIIIVVVVIIIIANRKT